MAQQLWLLRHGEAVPHDDGPDEARPLTDRGREQARAAGRALAALSLNFHAVFTSPRVRALETARLACEALGVEPLEHAPLGGGFDADEALALLGAPGEQQRVLLIGHEPDFSRIVHALTGGSVDFKKGGVAGLRVDGTRSELIALLRPRELALIG
jgi:phosphohistidine phosphatase